MPTAGSPAKCQCCCVDRLCSRGENRGGPPPQGMEQPGRYLPGCFFMPPRKKPPLMLSGGQTVKGPRRVCVCGRKESPIIFFGDMCGEENTSQAASVEFVRRRRTNYARSRLQPLCQKGILFDSPTGRARQCGQICFLRQRGRTSQGRAARWHTSAAKHPCPCPCRA